MHMEQRIYKFKYPKRVLIKSLVVFIVSVLLFSVYLFAGDNKENTLVTLLGVTGFLGLWIVLIFFIISCLSKTVYYTFSNSAFSMVTLFRKNHSKTYKPEQIECVRSYRSLEFGDAIVMIPKGKHTLFIRRFIVGWKPFVLEGYGGDVFIEEIRAVAQRAVECGATIDKISSARLSIDTTK